MNITSPEIATMRAKEAQAAASMFSAKLLMLQGYDDGMLYSYNQTKVRQDITEHVRREKPGSPVAFELISKTRFCRADFGNSFFSLERKILHFLYKRIHNTDTF